MPILSKHRKGSGGVELQRRRRRRDLNLDSGSGVVTHEERMRGLRTVIGQLQYHVMDTRLELKGVTRIGVAADGRVAVDDERSTNLGSREQSVLGDHLERRQYPGAESAGGSDSHSRAELRGRLSLEPGAILKMQIAPHVRKERRVPSVPFPLQPASPDFRGHVATTMDAGGDAAGERALRGA